MSDRRLELSVWALLVVQVVHGLTPARTDAEGYVGPIGGLLLLVATMTAIAGLRWHRPWARSLTAWTGLAVAVGFTLYHATPIASPVTNPYVGEQPGLAAWLTVILSIAVGIWTARQARMRFPIGQ